MTQHIKTLLASAALISLPAVAYADHHNQEADKNQQTSDQVEMSETVGETEVTTTIDPSAGDSDSDMDSAETDSNWNDDQEMDTAETPGYGTNSDMRANQSANNSNAQNTTRTASADTRMQPSDIDAIVIYQVGDLNPSYLASAWLGESVYNNNGEELGDVTDLVLDSENGVVAAVLSVGGLWDIGDTDVAVPINEFIVTRYEDSEPRLTLAYTEDELLNASNFGDD